MRPKHRRLWQSPSPMPKSQSSDSHSDSHPDSHSDSHSESDWDGTPVPIESVLPVHSSSDSVQQAVTDAAGEDECDSPTAHSEQTIDTATELGSPEEREHLEDLHETEQLSLPPSAFTPSHQYTHITTLTTPYVSNHTFIRSVEARSYVTPDTSELPELSEGDDTSSEGSASSPSEPDDITGTEPENGPDHHPLSPPATSNTSTSSMTSSTLSNSTLSNSTLSNSTLSNSTLSNSTLLSGSFGPTSPELGITERCYGFILLNHPTGTLAAEDNTSILLIHQRRPPPSPPYWGFPKGHPEPQDASNWATALRELHEETGLNPESVRPFAPSSSSREGAIETPRQPPKFTSQYPSRRGGTKEVTYFMGSVEEHDQFVEQAEEVLECRWVKLSMALQMVVQESQRNVLEAVIEYIARVSPRAIKLSFGGQW